MIAVREGFDMEYLIKLINERCGLDIFLARMHITRKHFERLQSGTAELRQDEMLRAAAVLGLDNSEFTRCFFAAEV